MKGKNKTSTNLGKFISIVIIGFLCYMFFSSDMINKTNPTVLTQDMELNSHPYINLNNEDFTLVFAISDGDNIPLEEDETLFSWSVRSWKWESNNLNGVGGYKKAIDEKRTYHKCTEKDFPRNPEIYTNLGLKGALCLDTYNITVGGFWDEKEVTTFIIELYKCVNGTKENVICKPKEVINNYLTQKTFNIWIEQKNIDSNNYENPISYKIKNYYQTIYTDKYKINHLTLKNVLLTTNDGFFFDNKHTIASYVHGDFDSDTSDVLDDGLIYDFMIYSSGQQKQIIRNYQKISSLLANLGGICNSFMILGFFLCKFQNNLNLKKKILASLYNIGDVGKSKFSRLDFKKQRTHIISDNSIINEFEKQKQLKKFEIYQNNLMSKKKLNFSIFNYIKVKLLPFIKASNSEKFFKAGEIQFNQDIDVIRILKKLKEIDKLKSILLDSNQIFFFDLLSKPTLNVQILNKKPKKLSIYGSVSFGGKKINTMEMMNKFKEMMDKKNKTQIDHRILDLIDENIKKSITYSKKKISNC